MASSNPLPSLEELVDVPGQSVEELSGALRCALILRLKSQQAFEFNSGVMSAELSVDEFETQVA